MFLNNITPPPNPIDDNSIQYLNTMADNKKAMLFLFTPKNVSDQFRRPHQYRFNVDFINETQNTIEDTASRGMNINLSSYMLNKAPVLGAVVPRAQGIPISMHAFREMWTFVLIVDNDREGISIFPSAINTRTIYSGFCADEPIGIGISGQTPPINQNCFMVITHRTTVNVSPQMDMYGTKNLVHTMANADIIPAQQVHVTAPGNEHLFTLLPENILRSTANNSGDTYNVYPAQCALQPNNFNPQIGSEMSSPRHHLQKVVAGLQETVLQSHPIVGDEEYMSVMANGMDIRTSAFENRISSQPAFIPSSIKCDEPVSLGQIVAKYPNIDVIDCRSNFNTPWETNPQIAPNAINVGSSILASTVPFLLSSYGLASISFRYNSWYTDNISPRGIDQVFEISSLVQMNDSMLKAKYGLFLDNLKSLVFPMLENINGVFDLTMSCSLMGASLIDLRYMDSPGVVGGFYETPNTLGGVLSPLIGDVSAFENNAGELNKLSKAILDIPYQYQNNILFNP